MSEPSIKVEMGERAKRLASPEARSIYNRARVHAVTEGGLYLWPQMVAREPSGATGMIRTTTRSEVSNLGEPRAFVGPSGAASSYAYYADQGRAPGGYPPIEAIAYWARRKGIAAPPFLIARAIARKGTKGSEFVRRTAQEAGPAAQRIMAGRLLTEVAQI